MALAALLVALGVIAGVVGTWLVMRDSSTAPASVTSTGTAVSNSHGANQPPVVCFDEGPFGAKYEERCGRGYSTEGLTVDQSLVGKSVRVTRMSDPQGGLNLFLIAPVAG